MKRNTFTICVTCCPQAKSPVVIQALALCRSGQRPNVLRELQQHGYGAHGSGVGTGRCSDFNTDRAIGNAAAKSSRSVADLFASMRNRSSAGSSSDASGGRNGSSMRGADRVHAAGKAGTCHTMLDDVHPLIATSGGGPATAATTLLVSPGASGMQQVPAEVLVTQLPPAGRASPPTVIHHTQPQIQRINYEQSLTQGQVPAKGPAAQAGAVGYSRLAAALAAKQSPAALSPSTAVTQSDPGVSPSSCAAAKLAPIFSLAKSSAAAESTGCSARNADGTTSGSIMLGPDIGVVLGARAGANRTHATSAHAPLDASAGSQRMQVEFTSSLQPAKRRKLWCENL